MGGYHRKIKREIERRKMKEAEMRKKKKDGFISRIAKKLSKKK